MTTSETRHRYGRWLVALALLPLLAAGLYIASVTVQGWFRYDKAYFTPEFQERYHTPGVVAWELQQALQKGDAPLYAQLTGLRSAPRTLEPNPNIILTILLEVDERDYFHYLYFNVRTYRRTVHHIKEVNGRWVVVPEDAYFYFDSGRWFGVFLPVAIVWWLLLVVGSGGLVLFRTAARVREAWYRA